jgi:hypothetical protein
VSGHALGGLTREGLPGSTLFAIKRGGRLRPDVLLAETGGGPAVVKDWGARSQLVRATFARLALRREARAHRRLEGLGCAPRLLGRLDAHCLVLEYRPGTRISSSRPWIFGPRFAAALADAVAGLHARGVVHLDLAHRSNLGSDPVGRPLLFDLGAALCLGPRGRLVRALCLLARGVDRRALRKWRRRLAPHPGEGSEWGAASGSGRGASRPT